MPGYAVLGSRHAVAQASSGVLVAVRANADRAAMRMGYCTRLNDGFRKLALKVPRQAPQESNRQESARTL